MMAPPEKMFLDKKELFYILFLGSSYFQIPG